MGNAFTSPVKTFCKKTGTNYKKQTIRDHAADQRAHELNASRQNNEHKPPIGGSLKEFIC